MCAQTLTACRDGLLFAAPASSVLVMFLVCSRSRASYITFDFRDLRTATIYSTNTILLHKSARVKCLSVPFHSNSYIRDAS